MITYALIRATSRAVMLECSQRRARLLRSAATLEIAFARALQSAADLRRIVS